MGFTRSSSGLVYSDAYSSDTTGNYNISGGPLVVSGGELTGASVSEGFYAHKTAQGQCITMKGKRTGNYGPHTTLWNNANPTATASTQDGYSVQTWEGTWYFIRWIDGSQTNLATSGTDCPTDGNYGLRRLYLTGTGCQARVGTTTLGLALGSTDTTYTGDQYGGGKFAAVANQAVDDLWFCSSHLITCSGMTENHYLYCTDGTTAAEAQADGDGDASVNAAAVLFPFTSVAIYTGSGATGDKIAELTTGDHADMGGGDVFAYSAPAAGNPWYYYESQL